MTERDVAYDKPLAYEDDDGRIVYRASGLGSCPGALVRARLGVSGALPSDFMAERFQEGHDWEARVLAAGLGVDWVQMQEPGHLAVYGKVVESEAGVQVETEIAWGNKVVRCHPDAIVVQGSTLRQYVCEVKFLGDQMFRDITRDGKWPLSYEWQKAVEMLSTGLPMLYIIGQKVVEEDAAGNRMVSLGEVWTQEYDNSEVPFTLKEVKARVLEIEGYVARGEMPPCPQPFMYPCAYWADHEQVDRPVITDEAIVAWIDVWKRAKDDLVKAEAAMEFVRGAIAEQMVELGITGGVCDGVDLAQVPAQERGNVSWKKAYAALAKETGKQADIDKYRGKPTAGYVRIEAKDG